MLTAKQQKRIQAEKIARQIMESPMYRKARREDQEQATLDAYCKFILIACDFLQIRHNYKRQGMINFLKYATECIHYLTDEDANYFDDMNQVMIDECGIDVMGYLGVKFKKGEEE